jgi:PKD repeat protein
LFVDAGILDTHTATIDWGDGSPLDNATIFFSSGSGAIGGTHTYADDGVYTVTIILTDDDGGNDSESFQVTVNNVPPVLVTAPNQTVNEGQLLNLSGTGGAPPLGLFVDVGIVDTHTAIINWGDGSSLENAAVFFSSGSGALGGTHTYADDGVYTVILTIQDDDGGTDTEQFTVTVKNVVPKVDNVDDVAVNEGSAFTLVGLNVLLSDPGFDNPLNPLPGGELQETFAVHSINWGDGSPTDTTSVSIVNRVSGSPGVPTTAQFDHDLHTYADDGFYTVTIRVADDDMGAFADATKFVTGVAGVDFIDLTFTIRVDNVNPTLTSVTPSVTTINESEGMSFSALFSDPGFDNPLNPNAAMPPTITDPLNESFTYDIDWGDGRQEEFAVAVADMNGSPGVPSTGGFGGAHIYADDGTYTVSVTIRDDNGGLHTRTFEVVVLNVNPAFVPPSGGGSFEGDEVSSEGITTIRVDFEDPGFDNTANPNADEPPTVTDTLHESFTHVINWGDGTIDAVHTYPDSGVYTVTVTRTGPDGVQTFSFPGFDSSLQPVLTLVSSQAINDPMAVSQAFTFVVDWGDGNVQTIQLMLKQPGVPLFNNGLTTVLTSTRTSGGESVLTTGSFDVQHRYLGPPDPANASADIRIDVTIVDDNNGTVTDFILVENPGIDTVNVAIDTTPDIPRLEVFLPEAEEVFLGDQSSFAASLQQGSGRVVTSDVLIGSERYLELHVIAPDGTIISRHRIRDEALDDLRAFFASLPDNHYRIYLVRTDNNTYRLIMDVYVRRGRVIDPSDDSEGTRDRPPTSEEIQQVPPPPLEENPNLEPVPDTTDNTPNAGVDDLVPDELVENESASDIDELSLTPEPLIPLRGSHRWVVPLAGFALGAIHGGWSQRVNQALENADERDWERLRRAGRLAGRSNRR